MTANQADFERQHELATFLRSRRARIQPEHVGLPSGARRRTPGLRRGEVAQLAGVSPEWYTWLEQGRDIHVSVQVLERLASVLRLDSNERTHLFLLALRQPPPVETYTPPPVSPSLRQFLDQMGNIPACIADARMNVVEWNAAHEAVFVNYDPNMPPERARNLIWRLFAAPARRRNKEWDTLARIYLAMFRAGYGRFINDPWWAEQIADLNQISPEFRELWPQHDVRSVSEGYKTMLHPVAGPLVLHFLWLQTIDAVDLRLLIHTPRDQVTVDKIARLLAGATDWPELPPSERCLQDVSAG